jgi:hypothetical protein
VDELNDLSKRTGTLAAKDPRNLDSSEAAQPAPLLGGLGRLHFPRDRVMRLLLEQY